MASFEGLAMPGVPTRPVPDRPLEQRFSVTAFQLAVGCIVALAAAVRLWNIGSVPIELHPDEMAPYIGVRDMLVGYRPFAPFIEADVVYLPMYGMFEMLSTSIFGVTTTALRLPAALFGVATAYATALLAASFVRDRFVFLIAFALMAILPWDVALSRVGAEPAAALPFVLFGLYFLRRGLVDGAGRFAILGFVLLALSAYTYRAASFDAFWLGAALLAVEYRRGVRLWRPIVIGFAAALLVVTPLVIAIVMHPAYLSSGPAQMTFAIGVNRDSIQTFVSRYLAQLSPLAIFANGDGNLLRGPDAGVLYWWTAPFIVVGIIAPTRLLDLRSRLFLIAWGILYPIGNGMVNEVPQVHFGRTLIGAPLFTIWAAIGCVAVWQWLRERMPAKTRQAAALTVFAYVVFFQFAQFCGVYFIRYPEASAQVFEYGNREIFAYVRANANKYDRVCLTAIGGWNWTALTRYYMADSKVELHSRIEFVCAQPRTLYGVEKRSDAPKAAELLGTVQNRDGTVRAYFLGS